MFLPVRRADISVNDARRSPPSPSRSMQMFPGGHFFLDTERGVLLRVIAGPLLPT
jgi:hypothetical protein